MKITKYFLSLAAAVGLIAGCQKEEMVQIAAPEDVVAPVLDEIAEIKITKDNVETEKLTLKWTSADFKAYTQINYAVEIAVGEGGKHTIATGITDTTAVVEYNKLNTVLVSDMDLTPNVQNDLNFYISAKVGAYAKVYSAPVAVKVTPVDAVIAEKEKYKHVYVVGNYCGWDNDKKWDRAYQFLYNYDSENADIYTGVIDFGDKAEGFKLTGGPSWNEDNWGTLADANPEPEVAELQLRDDGGSGDIKCYAKRFYLFSFDKSTLVLKVEKSFNSLGVVGDFNSWADDVEMEYNPILVRFYADVTLTADGGLKVRADADPDWKSGDWGVKEGEDCTEGPVATGGSNVALAAGSYRIYLDLNKGTIEASAKMFGKAEPGVSNVDPEPEPISYVVRGNFTSWGDGDPVAMTNSGDIWTAKKLSLAAVDEFKVVCSDGTWFGATAESNAVSTIDPTNAYQVYKPELNAAFEVASGDTKNIAVGVEGQYDIVFDAANNTVTVKEAKLIEGWAIAGDPTAWADGADIVMTQNGIVWSVKGVELKATEGWKLRKDGAWASGDLGGKDETPIVIGTEVGLAAGGKNMKVEADGTYDIYFNEALSSIFVLTAGSAAPTFGEVYFLVGAHNGWADAFNSAANALVKGDEYYTLKGLTLASGTELKFSTANWGKQYIANSFYKDAELALVDAGSRNMKASAGTYDVYVTLDFTKVYFMTDGKTPADAGAAPEPEEPELPQNLYMTGEEFGNWFVNAEEVVSLIPVYGKPAQFWTIRYLLASGDGYKFNSSIGWDGKEFAGLTDNDGYTADGNAKVAEDGLYMIHIDLEREKVHFEKARVYGMGDCFGGWTEGMETALFATEGETVTATLPASGNIRIYAASDIADSDWWSREFIFFDGKIAYRGAGGDQAAVAGTAGQKITLNFNEGTATVE